MDDAFDGIKKNERLEESVKPMRTAIELMPKSAELHNNFGNTLWSLGNFLEAESNFREAISFQPNHQNAIFNLGILLLPPNPCTAKSPVHQASQAARMEPKNC